jgi:hypothetical protein
VQSSDDETMPPPESADVTRLNSLRFRAPIAGLLAGALAAGAARATEAGAPRVWRVDFAGVRGARLGMTAAEVARR